ncbi:hypothetical protein CRYUN_Cryun22dG0020200 [Craigia yunnanensis]
MENLELRSSSTQAKIIGTIASISGALVIVFYKGAKVFSSPPLTQPSVSYWTLGLGSSQSNWTIGGLQFAVQYLLASIWYIIQGFTGTSLTTLVHTWGLHIKGPVYVALFKPLFIAIAAVFSAIFLGDALHLGSMTSYDDDDEAPLLQNQIIEDN